ncbi:MAG: DUF1588 domain-containing protein [Lentisphaeraceae bacterium]|nr:DUF1588 domain-containing protein [Lentisphaeraceae bacterium]
MLKLIQFSIFLSFFCSSMHAETSNIPAKQKRFLDRYCLDCHDQDTMKGDVSLDFSSIDWNSHESKELWEKVLEVTHEGSMPPKKKKKQPTENERHELVSWLDQALLENSFFGGTLARRLSKGEYENTIRSLFDIKKFNIPIGFPKDNEYHGFNNVGKGLRLSGPLMESYSQVARQIADELYPLVKKTAVTSTRTAKPEDMVLSFSASTVRDGALRFVSRSVDIMRSCSWPSRMEVTASGVYRITVDTSTFKLREKDLVKGPMILEIRARDLDVSDRAQISAFRHLKDIKVTSEDPITVTFDAELYEGQTLIFRWKNGLVDSYHPRLAKHVEMRFEKDKRFLAAWQQTLLNSKGKTVNTGPLRGLNGWEKVKARYYDKNLDLSKATMDHPFTKNLIQTFNNLGHAQNMHDTFSFDYFDHGPALELHKVVMEGPLKVVKGPKDKKRKERQKLLMGFERTVESNEETAYITLQKFLPKAFRRPVDEKTIQTYMTIVKNHWQQGHSFEEGMHLLVRSILVSPRFLYRALTDGEMDNYDLASRLSYFLTQGPPDNKLRKLAMTGKISNPKVLEAEAKRLMPKSPFAPMVTSFTSQWLDTKSLNEIMPDPKFKFSESDIKTAKNEVLYSFNEILTKNRSMTDFIDPDFTYSTLKFVETNYKFSRATKENAKSKTSTKFQRLMIERGQKNGGLLGQSAIMMATANGVDTQPVVRGVWVLENVLGTPPPEPPKNVPALTPDTQGATTPRELLSKHTNNAACASCHTKIDPVGFVFENFDPVGRWRTEWPKSKKTIDASGELMDGTKIHDILDFKKWLVTNIDMFSVCLAEKLMIYGTGRVPNYSEKKEIEQIVKTNAKNGNGFKDLMLSLIQSKTFRTK